MGHFSPFKAKNQLHLHINTALGSSGNQDKRTWDNMHFSIVGVYIVHLKTNQQWENQESSEIHNNLMYIFSMHTGRPALSWTTHTYEYHLLLFDTTYMYTYLTNTIRSIQTSLRYALLLFTNISFLCEHSYFIHRSHIAYDIITCAAMAPEGSDCNFCGPIETLWGFIGQICI